MRQLLAAALPLLVAASSPAQEPNAKDMVYGPCLTTTFEGGGRCGTTTKGLVVRLGDAGAVAFDTELLRVAAAWTDGWLRLRGTAYDESHGPMPALRGRKLFETNVGPGWAQRGRFDDPRPIPYGPLPRDFGQFRGYWLHGDSAVVGYRIGDMDVREGYAFAKGSARVLLRTLELGPSASEQWLVVGDAEPSAQPGAAATPRLVDLQWSEPKRLGTELSSAVGGWDTLATGGPSSADHLDAKSGAGAKITFVPGFATVHGSRADDRALGRLCDGEGAANADDWQRSVWFDKRRVEGHDDDDDGRFLVEFQDVVDLQEVHSYTWHRGYRSVQEYDLYASTEASQPAADASDPEQAGWLKLASVDSESLGPGDKHGVAVCAAARARRLLFVVRSGSAFFSEIDVFTSAHPDPRERPRQHLAAALCGDAGPALQARDGRLLLQVPAHAGSVRVQLAVTGGSDAELQAAQTVLAVDAAVAALPTEPAPARWGEPIVTAGVRGADDGAFAVDTLTIPLENRFHSRMRTGAFDFFADGRAAVSTWNGDVWIVSGIDDDLDRLEWRRFATGLFDPLGLRIVDGVVHVHGRDGITRLHDENGDGEADFFECFTNAIYATPAFHEFAFDLQTDVEGNFYVSKGAPVNPGGRGFMTIVPHHGTILKIRKDGGAVTTIATGLRAPNGIGVGKNGVVTSGDNEGTFMPRCRLNWITKPGFYGGVRPTAQRSDVPDQPDLPLCWFPMDVDNSSGGQVWVEGSAWRGLDGRLLHLSYGTCSVYLVLKEEVDGIVQGGVVRLPANFSSSCMRGRFSATDGQLYVIGLKGWQTSAAREGGFHRVRRTKAPLGLPIALRTCERGVYLTFAEPLDAETAADAENYGVEIWDYLYSPNYGSPEVSILHPERKAERGKENRDPLPVAAATLSPDGRTVFLAIDGMRPVHQMKLTWNVDAKDGRALKGDVHHTIHRLAKDPGFPAAEAR